MKRNLPAFKILTIDGGGFKGLYTARLLAVFEERYGRLNEHFDMVCGTSTGGLIALGIAAGMTAQQIVDFYVNQGPRIFSGGPRPLALARQYLGRKHRYGSAPLRRALEETFGTLRMADAGTYLCVPSFDIVRMDPRVFKTQHAPHLTRDRDISLVEVGLATSAAPLFFPISHCQESGGRYSYVDGGIWANNPALVGLTEAGQYFVGPEGPYHSVRILSVANVAVSSGNVPGAGYPFPVWRWATMLAEMAAEGQQRSTETFMRFLAPALSFDVEYVRVPAEPVSPGQGKHLKLDVATPKAIDTLMALGNAAGQRLKADDRIAACFAEPAAKLRPKGMDNG